MFYIFHINKPVSDGVERVASRSELVDIQRAADALLSAATDCVISATVSLVMKLRRVQYFIRHH